MTPVRVLAADRYRMTMEGIRLIFNKTNLDIELIDVVSDQATLKAMFKEHKPEVLLMDVELWKHPELSYFPSFDVKALVGWARKTRPDVLVLIFTHHENTALLRYLLEVAEADGVLYKANVGSALPEIILDIYKRRDQIGIIPIGGLETNTVGILPRRHNLSSSEEDLLIYVALHPDESINTMAKNMGLAVGTVNTHLASIYKKLGTKKRTETLLVALRLGIIPSSLVLDVPDSWAPTREEAR